MLTRLSRTSFFQASVPPPEFLSMSSVGLDISNQSLRVVELKPSAHGFSLGKHGKRKIPTGAAYGDDIEKNQELKKALELVKKDYNLQFVSVSLPDDKAYIFKTSLPATVLPNEMRQSLQFQLEENVPISAEEAVFDFSILPADPSKDYVEAVVAVFPKSVAEGFVSMLNDVGLIPTALRLGVDATAHALIARDDSNTYIVVNFGEKNTGISIVSNGVVQFASTLNFGGEALTTVIQKYFSVSKEEAMRIKKSKDFIKNKDNMQLFFSLMNPVSALKDEIKRIVNYWRTHKDKKGEVGAPIKAIMLCGSDSSLRGLDEYLSITLGIEVRVGNVWTNAFSLDDYIPDIPFSTALSYATAIGMALGGHDPATHF